MSEQKAELSIGSVVGTVRSIIRYLFSRWLTILIISLIGGALGYLYAWTKRPTFTGTLTFVLATEPKGGTFTGLASQFGLDMGGAGNDVFSGENIITLFKSKKMIKLVLFQKPPEINETLINIIVRDWKWDKGWSKKERVKKAFPFPGNPNALTPIQDSLVREVHLKIIKDNLTVVRTDKKLSVYSVTTVSTNPIFSCYLTIFLMNETAKFYIETKTSLAKQNLAMLVRESDSLRNLLSGVIQTTAGEADRTFNLNPALQVQRAPQTRGQVRATVLATAYGEVVKNLEIAKINLQKETPLYQIIDVPELPMKAVKLSKLLMAIFGAMVFGLFTIFILLFRKKYILKPAASRRTVKNV